MQRFDTGDHILVLPRFAHLYSSNSGEILDVQLDPHRAIFNEYTVKFPDGSIDRLFEFQIQKDVSHYETFEAILVFDSTKPTTVAPFRGAGPDRHLLFQTPTIDIDMKIFSTKSGASIIGQILERTATGFVADAEVTLMSGNVPAAAGMTDNLGTFVFRGVASGPIEIEILIPAKSLRISGSFAI